MPMGDITRDNLGTYLNMYMKRAVPVMNMGIQNAGILTPYFPVEQLDTKELKVRWVHGVPGRKDVDLDTPVENSSWDYKETSKQLKWDKFSFQVTDAAVDAAEVNRMAADGIEFALEYFAHLRDFKMITELKAKNNANCTHAADAVWTSGASQVEADIVKAIEGIVRYGAVSPTSVRFGVLYPAKVLRGIEQLALIKNVQQSLKSYIQNVFPVDFIAYQPYADPSGNNYLDIKDEESGDALGTSALVFVEGAKTMACGQYRGRNGITMQETTRIHDVGFKTTLRNSFGCLARPLRDDSTYTTPYIYEITGVTT